MGEAIKWFLGATEINVGSIEADVSPVPGSDTDEGRAEIVRLSHEVLNRAWQAASQKAYVVS